MPQDSPHVYSVGESPTAGAPDRAGDAALCPDVADAGRGAGELSFAGTLRDDLGRRSPPQWALWTGWRGRLAVGVAAAVVVVAAGCAPLHGIGREGAPFTQPPPPAAGPLSGSPSDSPGSAPAELQAPAATAPPSPAAVTTETVTGPAIQAPPSGTRAGETTSVDLGGGQKLELVWCPAGSFTMGSPANEADRYDDEMQHRVTLTKGFWIGKYEVTNGQYRQYKAAHDSGSYKNLSLNGDRQPVVNVSWNDAQEFCTWLSRKTGQEFRLPTEAEWEYACRAGTTTMVPWGELDGSTGRYANVADRTAKAKWSDWMIIETDDGQAVTAPVGTYRPNAWGLHDMIGNVWEWCGDWYGDYPAGATTDPPGPSTASRRVLRGGSWCGLAWICRAALRCGLNPAFTDDYSGFRVVLVAPLR